MAEEQWQPASSVSPSRVIVQGDCLTSAPSRISSTPTLFLGSKDSTKSFPAFRLKKSYWRKEKLRGRGNPGKESVTQVFSHRLPSYGKTKPTPMPLAELVTVSHDKRGYNSLSRLRRSAAEASEYPLWRRLAFFRQADSEEKCSPPAVDRSLYLSIESLRGKYSVSKLDKVRTRLASHLHGQSPPQREKLKQASTPQPRLAKHRGKLLPTGTMHTDQARLPGNANVMLPEIHHIPAV